MDNAPDPELKKYFIEFLKTERQKLEKSSNLLINTTRNQIQNLANQLKAALEKIDKEKKAIFDIMNEIICIDKISKDKVNDTQILLTSSKKSGKKMLKSLIKSDIKEAFMWLFKEQSKTLKKIDLKSLNESKSEINLPELICSKISMCILPNNNVFCYGNYVKLKNAYSGITFMINNSDQGRIQMLTEGTSCRSSGLAYHDEAVYSFGGLCHTSLNLCQKYNLKENKWEKLQPLDKPISCCSCEILDKTIVYSGIETGIYIYKINSNSHSLVLPLLNCLPKVIFSTGERIIVAENGGKMYESGAYDVTSWVCIGNSQTPELEPAGCKVLYKNSIIFALAGSKLPIFQFSIKTKKINYFPINKPEKKNEKKNMKKNEQENKQQNNQQNNQQVTQQANQQSNQQNNQQNKQQNSQQNNTQNKPQNKEKVIPSQTKQVNDQIDKKLNGKKNNKPANKKNKNKNKAKNNQPKGNQAKKEENKNSNPTKKQESKQIIKKPQESSSLNESHLSQILKLEEYEKSQREKKKELQEAAQIKTIISQKAQLNKLNEIQGRDFEEEKKEKICPINKKLEENQKIEEEKENNLLENELYIYTEDNILEHTTIALKLLEKEEIHEVILKGYNLAIPNLMQIVEEIKSKRDCLYQINEFYNLSINEFSEENDDSIEDDIEVIVYLSKIPLNSAHYGYQPPSSMIAPLTIYAEPFSHSWDPFNFTPNHMIEAPLTINTQPFINCEDLPEYYNTHQDLSGGEKLFK